MKCSELSCSVLDVVLPFKQLKLCTNLMISSNCLPFDNTIMLLLCFFLGSHAQSLIMKSDCCGFCQMTKNRAANSNKTLFRVGMFPKLTPQSKSKASQFRDARCPRKVEQQMANFLLFKDLSGWQRFYTFYFYFKIKVVFSTPLPPLSPHVSFPHSVTAEPFLRVFLPAFLFYSSVSVAFAHFYSQIALPYTLFLCMLSPHSALHAHTIWVVEAGLKPITYSLGLTDCPERVHSFLCASYTVCPLYQTHVDHIGFGRDTAMCWMKRGI